jgi:hypothetical protein
MVTLRWIGLLIWAMVVAGCATNPIESDEGSHRGQVPPQSIPTTDTSRANVPLEDIVFDTFRPVDRAVTLPQASPDLIESLVDAIPPIHNPIYEMAAEADWLDPSDRVLGYSTDTAAYAYPVRILNFHEIVNDEIEGVPVLVSYCPLCASGIVFDRRLQGRTLTFGNTSALYQSDMVMLDYETGSYWWQVAGQAIVGPLAGEVLTLLPSALMQWDDWVMLHPDTTVLARETGFNRDYGRDPFVTYDDFIDSGRFAFPVDESLNDARLPASQEMLVFETEDTVYAVPLKAEDDAVLEVGSTVVLYRGQGGAAGVFQRRLDGDLLEFEVTPSGFMDRVTGSVWQVSGVAVDGPLAGDRLVPIPSKWTFWFAAVAAEPDLQLVYLDSDSN